MKYFVGYLILGDAAAWHSSLTADIANKFGIEDHDKRIAPHITLFRPFDASDITSTIHLLEEFSKSTSHPGRMIMSGFNHFDHKVIFADITCDDDMRKSVVLLQQMLDQEHLPDRVYPSWRPHATLASKISEEEGSKILEYVNTLPGQRFEMAFDNVSLFRLESDKWVVDRILSIN